MPNGKLVLAGMIAAVIIFLLASGFAAFFMFGHFPARINDGVIEIPDPTTAFLETRAEETELTSEGLTFKGNFDWEVLDGSRRTYSGICYLWIHMTDTGTQAKFSFGEHQIDGWPVFLVSQEGDRYVFESSKNSFVERVKIVADVTDVGVTGTVENITPDISSFVKGSFTGESIPFEQYKVDVID